MAVSWMATSSSLQKTLLRLDSARRAVAFEHPRHLGKRVEAVGSLASMKCCASRAVRAPVSAPAPDRRARSGAAPSPGIGPATAASDRARSP